MRVGIFVSGIGRGAFARVAAALAKGMANQGVDVDVLFVHRDGPQYAPDFPHQTRLLHLGTTRTTSSIPALARYLRIRDPAVLVSLSWVQNPPAVLAKILSRWQGTLILNEASSMSYEAGIEHRRDIRFRYMPSIARLLYPKADGVIVPSGDVFRDLRDTIGLGRRGPPLRVIPNPVDIEAVRLLATEEPERRDLLAPGKPVILGVGRLARQKNFSMLIRAFAVLLKDTPATLLILGEGPERERLQTLIGALGLQQHVVLPGMVGNPFAFMRRADILALPSEEEGFGLVLIEAMAVGLPIVATRCPGGPVEILGDGEFGKLVPSNDEGAMANALRDLLADDRLRSRLVRSGLRRAEDYASEAIASQWLSFAAEVSVAYPADG